MKSIITVFFNYLSFILRYLDNVERTQIYIGVTGIIIAIVIFIAEVISKEEIESSKKLLLKKSKIKCQIYLAITILFITWISKKITVDNDILYYLFQLLIDLLIICSSILTAKSFSVSLRLKTDKEYLNKEFDKYTQKAIMKLNKKNQNNKEKLNKEKDRFIKFINSSEILTYDEYAIKKEKMKNFDSIEDGYISKINYKALQKTLNKIKITIGDDTQNSKEAHSFQPHICFLKNVGDKVNKNYPVLYYENIDDTLISEIQDIFNLDNENMCSEDYIKEIINDLFKYAQNDGYSFDTNNRIKNFYNFLVLNKEENIITILKEKIRNFYFTVANNYDSNVYFSKFLYDMCKISLKNDKYNDFEFFCLYLTGIYLFRTRILDVDVKQVTYDYINKFFNAFYYRLNNEKNINYYNCLLSNLLNYINELIKRKDYESSIIAFRNIHVSTNKNYFINRKDMTDIEKSNIQFVIGIFYSILYSYSKISEQDKIIVSFIDCLNDKFIPSLYFQKFIEEFKVINSIQSSIKEKYDNFGFDVVDHKYLNSWSGDYISDVEVLKAMLYILKIPIISNQNVDESVISVEHKYYYQNIQQALQQESYPILEKLFDYGLFHLKEANDYLDKIINIIGKKEQVILKEKSLDSSKIKKFIEIIVEKSNKKSPLIEICVEKRIGKSKAKIFGINQIIERSIFFPDIYGMEGIAKSFASAFPNGIEKEIIKEVISNSLNIECSLEEQLKIISQNNNLNDYCIITNRYNSLLYNNNYDSEKCIIKIGKVKLKVVISDYTNDCILINKKQLPKIKIYKFNKKYDASLIINDTFIEVKDLSNNSRLRKTIIKNSEWLKEKGTPNQQDDYLKAMCILKIFKSFEVVSDNCGISYLIKTEE